MLKKGGFLYPFSAFWKELVMLGCFKRKGKKYVLIYYPLTNYDMRIIVNESKVVNNFVFTIL